MGNFVIEKIQLIDKKQFIQVIPNGIIKKIIPIIKNLNVPMELIVIEKILIILMNILIIKNDQPNNEHRNVKVDSTKFFFFIDSKRIYFLGNDDEEDDDDGLPNEYDYSDTFIDDEDLDDSTRIDRAASLKIDPDNDWKPHKKARQSDNEDEDHSSDESEINLLREEAAEFVQNSSINLPRPAKKKARLDLPNDDD
jgi:hypothetical protein